jgi:hypothetical protein
MARPVLYVMAEQDGMGEEEAGFVLSLAREEGTWTEDTTRGDPIVADKTPIACTRI